MATFAQFVTLGIDADVFAVPVESVQEILELSHIARLPHAPDCVLGMIDVRGQSFPVIDLRARLGLPPVPPTEATRIVILKGGTAGLDSGVGLVAERVFEVSDLDDGRLEPPPSVGPGAASACVAGVGRRNGRFVVVFDLERLMTLGDDVRPILAAAQAA